MKKPEINTSLRGKHLKAGRTKVAGIITHDTAGTGKHNDTLYLANPGDGRKVSVDFTVERDGSIWQLNPDLRKFYTLHAGRATRFKGLVNGQVTRACIGIEICQKADLSLSPVYTDEQIKAVAQLCAWLMEEFSLAPSDITTHRNIITDGSRSDPRQFPFEDTADQKGFWSYLWEFRGRGEVHEVAKKMQKTPTAEGQYKVVAGDSLYKIAAQVYGGRDVARNVERIKQANPGAEKLIVPGQVLIIPAS